MHFVLSHVFLLILFCASRTMADATSLAEAILVPNGSAMLDVGYGSSPTLVDWNNDGLQDLLVGNERTGARLRLYPNVESRKLPIFDSFITLRSGSDDITDPSSG
jgi:hypothetical protein